MHRKLDSASLEDLERLVKGIDRHWVTYIVRNTPYLLRHVFRGFRPDHLPWGAVPSRLARDAGNDATRRGALLYLWTCSNAELQDKLAAEVRAESFEADVTALLARIGVERRERLWWALYLDDRDDVYRRFTEGNVSSALLDATSSLVREAKRLAGVVEAGGDKADGEESVNSVEGAGQMTDGDQRTELDAPRSAEGNAAASGAETEAEAFGAREWDSVHKECKSRLAEALRLLDEVRLENAGLKMRLRRLEGHEPESHTRHESGLHEP